MRLPLIRHQVSSIRYQVSKKGFTLIELLIVMAIIAILISIGLAAFTRAQAQARDGQRQSDLRNIQGALEQYYSDNNVYPSDPYTELGTYLREVPKNPDGSNYNYVGGGGQTYCLTADLETDDSPSQTCPIDASSHDFVITQSD